MPTPAGWGVLAASIPVAVLGRAIAAPVLFVLAASLVAAVLVAVASVSLRPVRLTATRSVHPTRIIAGHVAEVEITITDHGLLPSPPLVICDPIVGAGGERSDRRFSSDGATRDGRRHRLTYPIDTTHRGIFTLGPLRAERSDILGLARRHVEIAASEEVVVTPRTVDVTIPIDSQGDFGIRLSSIPGGIGEFGGLRAYRPGDEPRSIHWPATARSGELTVREYITDSIRRCTVVLDTSTDASPDDRLDARLETVVGIAASLVAAAAAAGLMIRLVTSDGHDRRGHDIVDDAGRVLAGIGMTRPITRIGRDPADGRGLVLVVALSAATAERLGRMVRADLAIIAGGDTASIRTGRRLIDVDSLDDFATIWRRAALSTVAR